jgi:phosphate transport system permease protein
MVNKPFPVLEPGHRSLRGNGGNGDRAFETLTLVVASFIVVLLAFIIIMLVIDARQSIATFGFDFLLRTEWNPVFREFGALAFIYGTLVTSFIALLLAVPVAVGAALFVAEYAPPWLRTPMAFTTELLAAIPSIIYGLWAFFVISPIMREHIEPALRDTVGQVPVVGILFSGQIIGKDLLTASVILAIMILPIITAISREIILQVPPTQREGMLALGATKWETVRLAVLPYARLGITGAAILGLARALGETMAVTMVIGNSSTAITGSLFTPGYTMASAIANQFNEADTPIYFSAIVQVALVLLLVSAIVNVLARLLVWAFSRRMPGQLRA